MSLYRVARRLEQRPRPVVARARVVVSGEAQRRERGEREDGQQPAAATEGGDDDGRAEHQRDDGERLAEVWPLAVSGRRDRGDGAGGERGRERGRQNAGGRPERVGGGGAARRRHPRPAAEQQHHADEHRDADGRAGRGGARRAGVRR